MAICPRCFQEIGVLKVLDYHTGMVVLDKDGNPTILYSQKLHEMVFSCPMCQETLDTLTNRPDLAYKFLSTGKMY